MLLRAEATLIGSHLQGSGEDSPAPGGSWWGEVHRNADDPPLPPGLLGLLQFEKIHVHKDKNVNFKFKKYFILRIVDF